MEVDVVEVALAMVLVDGVDELVAVAMVAFD
jgi:hypothetical protein